MARRPNYSTTYSVNPVADAEGWMDVEGIDMLTGAKERARLRVQPDQDGRLEIRELHLLDVGQAITPGRLRSLNIGFLGQMIAASALLTDQTAKPPKLSPSGQRGYGDDFYKAVAANYQAAIVGRRRPVLAIAESAGVPRSTAARWVKEARRRGFLGETSPGKARP